MMEAQLVAVEELKHKTRGRVHGYVQDGEDLLVQAADGTLYRVAHATARHLAFFTLVSSGDTKIAIGDTHQTSAGANALRLLLSFGIIFLSMLSLLSRNAQPLLVDSSGLAPQLAQLERLKRSLSDMADFVTSQESRVVDVADTLTEMRAEKRRLDQVLALTRDQVTALLDTQRTISSRPRLLDLSIAFGVGILSSLSAASIWHMALARARRRPEVDEAEAKT